VALALVLALVACDRDRRDPLAKASTRSPQHQGSTRSPRPMTPSVTAPRAPSIRYALHRQERVGAIFFGGDERAGVGVPAGWEEVNLRQALPDERQLKRWLALDPGQRILALCPKGFTALVPPDGSTWFDPRSFSLARARRIGTARSQ
jgi:hypothetical protein